MMGKFRDYLNCLTLKVTCLTGLGRPGPQFWGRSKSPEEVSVTSYEVYPQQQCSNHRMSQHSPTFGHVASRRSKT